MIICWSSEYHLMIILWSSDDHVMIMLCSFDDHLMIIWRTSKKGLRLSCSIGSLLRFYARRVPTITFVIFQECSIILYQKETFKKRCQVSTVYILIYIHKLQSYKTTLSIKEWVHTFWFYILFILNWYLCLLKTDSPETPDSQESQESPDLPDWLQSVKSPDSSEIPESSNLQKYQNQQISQNHQVHPNHQNHQYH